MKHALAIKTVGLTKIFTLNHQHQLTAVKNLTFEVNEGEIFGFLGPNGAGKTTTVRMLTGILKPTHGTAVVAGHDILRESLAVKKKIGIVFENPNLYERLSARKNLQFFARLYQLSRQRINDRIKTLTSLLEIDARLDSPVASFSKGMKQKLALARALIHDPEVLFLDEPTSHLDPAAARGIMNSILHLTEEESRTVLICTHRLELAEKLCTRVGIMNHGELQIQGNPRDLVRSRTNRQVEIQLLNSLNESQLQEIKKITGLVSVLLQPKGTSLKVTVENPESTIPQIIRTLVQVNADIIQVKDISKTLEDIYLEIVGKHPEA